MELTALQLMGIIFMSFITIYVIVDRICKCIENCHIADYVTLQNKLNSIISSVTGKHDGNKTV